MTDTKTTRLELPFLMPAQAQKHVTINEGLQRLDTLAQLSVTASDLSVPPTTPTEGAAYIVAASAGGAWAGQENKIALWQDSAWRFFTPQEGYRAWDVKAGLLRAYVGTAWQAAVAPPNPPAPELPTGLNFAVVSGTHQFTAGGSNTTQINIPAQTLLFGVAGRVTKGDGVSNFDIGIAGATNRFVGWMSGALGSSFANPCNPLVYWSDTPIVLTARQGQFSNGRLKLHLYIMRLTAPSA